MSFFRSGVLPLLTTLLVAAWCSGDPSPDRKPATHNGGLVVHEWGTFSTFSGSDGRQLKFDPYDNDLPGFVHGYQRFRSKEGPQGGLISLETPVLYFYTDRPLTASVRVAFPKGTLTEWFPQATRTDHELAWRVVELRPGQTPRLLSERKPSRYYAARETDAVPLQVSYEADGHQLQDPEKFLFYRGVGNFEMPLSVRALGSGRFAARWNGPAPDGDLILVQVRGGKIRFRPFHLDRRMPGAAEGDVRVPDGDGSADQLGDALAQRLVARGLFEKEARAMVKTWRSAWFGEPGTRVLYFLPRKLTEELLPLQVEPGPKALVRVLVGRHDVLTPEREQEIDSLVSTLKRPELELRDDQKAAWQKLCDLGRYHRAAQQAAESRLEGRTTSRRGG